MSIKVNRAPVLTLWAAVVAERLGFSSDEALSLARVVTGLTAYAKGVSIGLIQPSAAEVKATRKQLKDGERCTIDLLGRAVPAVITADGIRGLSKDQVVKPDFAASYVAKAFGDELGRVRAAMQSLAASLPPERLAREGFQLYVKFRPVVPGGAAGWGAKGELDVAAIEKLVT